MLFADTMAIFFVILGLLLAFPSLWLFCRALWPEYVARSTEAVGLKSFFIGIPVTAVAVVIVIVVGKLPASFGQIGGVLAFSALLLYALVGVAGLATHIGNRLPSPADIDKPWRTTLRGGIILSLTYLLPLLGWFLIIPVSVITGAGCATRALFQRKKTPSRVEMSEQPKSPNQKGIVETSGSIGSTGSDETNGASHHPESHATSHADLEESRGAL